MNHKKQPQSPYSPKEILDSFGSSINGLSSSSVPFQQARYGENILPKAPAISPIWCFLKQFRSPIIIILSIAGAIQFILGQQNEAFAIWGVLVFNAFLGFFQERRASSSMQALEELSVPTSKVIRDGKLSTIPTTQIVVGDLLYLDSGTKIGADGYVIDSHMLYVDESMFTGESLPVLKSENTPPTTSPSILESPHMVFSGTTVTKGRGKICVSAVGPHTESAAIASCLQEPSSNKAPLEIKIANFAKKILFITFFLTAILFIIGIHKGIDIIQLLMTSVSVLISAIPEGLPIAITAVLSFGLLQLAKKQAIVKDLSTVETLGSTSVICTDKTGTITRNQMEVKDFFCDEGTGKNQALEVLWLCSETRLEKGGFTGDPLEAALMRYALHYRPDLEQESTILTHPYESESQKMGVEWKRHAGTVSLWKGSFEAIAPICTKMWLEGVLRPIDKTFLQNKTAQMAAKGYRVLALAHEKIFVGLVGLEDPPRDDVSHVIESCKKAGIRIIVITGDHPETALHIARKTAIPIYEPKPYLTGSIIQTLSDEELFAIVEQTTIYARVTPTDKFRIVEQLKRHGNIVAMTGDGINDAPSIKKADIGIAMGTGSDVAKEAAQMILLDNSFIRIYEAIKQGRDIFRSIQQTLTYLVTTSLSGVFTILATTVAHLPLPLLPLHILFINMFTDGTITVPLALEKEHGDSMNHPPRKLFEPFLSNSMYRRSIFSAIVMTIGTVFMYHYTLKVAPLKAQTVAFATLSIFQLLNAYNSRSVRRSLFFTFQNKTKKLTKIPFWANPLMIAVSCGALLLQILVIQVPLLHPVFHTTSLTGREWTFIFLSASSIILYAELDKAFHFFLTKKDP